MTKKLDKTFTKTVTKWFCENKRDLPWRQDREPYHIWISEIMLQQTRVEAVREYYLRWMKALPTIKSLADAEEESLLKLWQGLGYYNRVRNMQKAARILETEYDGVFPDTYDEILKLPGIGDYTAGAIASNCFDQKVAAVDGNVLRVMSRITEDDSDILKQSIKKKYAAMLAELYPEKDCGNFTQGLMEIGATICVPNGMPKCDACPVADFCGAKAAGTALNYPVKKAKKERKMVDMTVFILAYKGKQAVQKRKQKGVLSGLYQYPNVEKKLDAGQAVALAQDWGCCPAGIERQREYKHIFSHVEWHMTGYYITCSQQGEGAEGDFVWATEKQMEEEIPLPSAFQPFYLK